MRVGTKLSVNFEAVLHLTEPEIRAMDALVGYGFEPFIKVFPTYHPAAVLRNRVLTRSWREDLKTFVAATEEGSPEE